MACAAPDGKLYKVETLQQHPSTFAAADSASRGAVEGISMIVGLACAIFVALFGWGAEYFGWSDPEGKIQLALFASFVLGAVSGYKSRV